MVSYLVGSNFDDDDGSRSARMIQCLNAFVCLSGEEFYETVRKAYPATFYRPRCRISLSAQKAPEEPKNYIQVKCGSLLIPYNYLHKKKPPTRT